MDLRLATLKIATLNAQKGTMKKMNINEKGTLISQLRMTN